MRWTRARKRGSRYYAQWRLAEQQIAQLERSVSGDPEQRRRAEELRQLFNQRGEQFSDVARYVQGAAEGLWPQLLVLHHDGTRTSARMSGSSWRRSPTPSARRCPSKIQETQFFSAEADRLTDYLSWLGVIVGLFAIFMGYVAVQALRLNAAARKEAESEFERAEQLEEAVRERTQELWEANQALKAEGESSARRPKRSFARSRRWKRLGS